MSEASQLYRLIEERLEGQSLTDYVATSRERQMSWRSMSSDLHRRTGIRVSYQTLRLWFNDRLVVETTVRVA